MWPGAAILACSLCNTRKEKRFCPALHARICPQCCGEQRELTLDCPSDCAYLQQARRHERARDLSELDRGLLFPAVEIRHEFVYQREPLIAGLSGGLARATRADRSLTDPDLIAALTALARHYETLAASGLVVDPRVAAPHQQAVVDELARMLAEYRELEARHLGANTLRDSEVLAALVFLVRMAHSRTSGRPRARGLVEWLQAQFPARDAASSVVVP